MLNSISSQILDSREVSEMVEKEHSKLIRDIRRYKVQLDEANIGSVEFFEESTYMDGKGEIRPCYQITKKGCEFVANKLTGIKGTIFTARYIKRFHEMQEMIEKGIVKIPWYIRWFNGNYIVLFRDFKNLTGIEIDGKYTDDKLLNGLEKGKDYNGWGWKNDNEKFKQKYGFEYGTEPCMMYMKIQAMKKLIRLIESNEKDFLLPDIKKNIFDGLKSFEKTNECQRYEKDKNIQPIQIIINLNNKYENV